MNILIFGATSDIAAELAKQYAQSENKVTLIGTHTSKLGPLQSDIKVRYGSTLDLVEFDILKDKASDNNIQQLISKSDVAIMLIGYLGDQDKSDQDDAELEKIVLLNYSKVVCVLNQIQRIYVAKKTGVIVGVSSAAGDRGKQSNYAYGSAKAGLTVYLDGLRNRLYHHGVHVVTIKPGFMATKMTENLDLPKPLTASPVHAAKAIFGAIAKKKNKIYISWLWRYIMFIINMIPEQVFKKMKM